MAFNLALLSDDTPEELALSDDANEAVVAEIAEGPDADLAAMDDVAGDISDAEATIEEGAASAETLEAVAAQVDESNKDGGLSAPAAEALRLCVEHITARMGMPAPKSLAAEGFASKSTRVRSGQLASEGIKEYAKQIWEYILKAYEKVKAWVIKWFNNFFDGATKVKNRAEKLKKAAEAKASAKVDPKDAKLVNPAYAAHLTVDGKPASGEQVAKAYPASSSSTALAVITPSKIDVIYSQASRLIDKVDDAKEFDTEIKGLVTELANLGEKGTIKGFKAPEDMELVIYEKLPLGGKVVVALVPKTVSDENVGKIKFELKSDGSANSTMNMDMTAADANTVKQIAEGVEAKANVMIEEKKEMGKLEKAFSGVMNSVKRAQGNTKDDAKARVKKAAKVIKAILGLTTGPFVQGRQGNLQSMNAALSYGAASLNVAKA